MADRNLFKLRQPKQSGQGPNHQQSMQNNRQSNTQGNRQNFPQDNRPQPTNGNQNTLNQNNDQPPRQNYQQSGRQLNDQTRGGRNVPQQQHGFRNEQQGGERNGQQFGGRNEQYQGGRRNDRGRNDQQQYGQRSEQQGGHRNDQQQQYRGRNHQEQPHVRRNEPNQDGLRNEQRRGVHINQQHVERNDQKPRVVDRNEPQPPTKKPEKPSTENIRKDSVALPENKGSNNACTELAIPRRADLTKAGTKGRRISVEANHLSITFPENMPTAIHYDVEIVPDKPKNLAIMAMEQFRRQFYPDRHPAYDGRKNLYSSSPLPIKDGLSCEVKIMEDDRERTFNIRVKKVATINLNILHEYFRLIKNGSKVKLPEEAIHCLEVVFRSAASRGCTSVGQSFFTMPRTMMDLGEGMQMYSGIYQSAILGWKPFLNVDVAHKPFPKCLRITDLIDEFCGGKSENMKQVDKFLRNLKVRYEIPGIKTSKRVSRVNQLEKNACEARFKNEEGIEMTVAEYYEKVKNHKLQYPKLPCLWVGNKQKRILYPAELCTLVENQVTNKTLTPNQTSKMIKYAATSSTVRKNKIMASVKAANYNNDQTVSEFGIKVSDQFVTLEARVLEPPMLQYSESSLVPKRGIWRADKFKTAKSLTRWAIFCTDGRVRKEQLQAFADKMICQGKFVGMNIERPSTIKTVKLSFQRAKDELRQEFANLKGVELIVVVIPEDKNTYGNVKQVAELQVGVLTQCVRSKNIFNLKDTTVANILLKVNAKLNGVNHSLYKIPECLRKPCIIMGADVTHPSPESNGMVPSVAAVTASHDPAAFQYNITWRLQPPTQEIITDLANIVKQHLIYFYVKNKVKPQRIIFFRDGVSEGQFKTVLREEVMAIRKACLMLEKEGTYKPAITFIVVQKRHHTRLFPKNPKDSEDKNLNVLAGTVVDTTITHPTDSDFYLVSHASIQGVARPTKYRKLWDDYGMHEDELQELTYHLCHMFSRCNRSVSYPAPTYYAHLAAARAKVYCEGINLSMNDNLEDMQKKLVTKKEIVSDLPMYFV